MNLGEAYQAGSREIRANKTRSVLSFAAISVGTASLLFTLAQTRGMRKSLEDALEVMGPGRIEVSAKENYQSKGISPGLTYNDALAVREQMPELYMVYPRKRSWRSSFQFGKERHDIIAEGVTPEFRKRDWVFKLRGRFFNEFDVKNATRVCVIVEPGGWLKKPFWAKFWWSESPWDKFITHRDLLGKTITLEGKGFTVVGVLVSPPRDLDPRWFNWNEPDVLLPITTFMGFAGGNGRPENIDAIMIDAGSEAAIGPAKSRIERLLLARHREPDFEAKDMREEIQGELEEFEKILTAFITLGAVALFAGGIGIMNVTLAAVFSRVKEIGIRRALGADRKDIMAQFLVEALLLGLAGGIAGVLLGWWGIDLLAKNTNRDVMELAWHHILQALAVSGLVSGGFALYPAYQASRLDPIEALRNE